MKRYIGTKVIMAKPMTRREYNDLGWEPPADEDGEHSGYLVEYTNGGDPNHPSHLGYISWSPADVFKESYRTTGSGLTFSEALDAIKSGHKLQRAGWNGTGMFVFLVPGSQFEVNRPPLLGIYDEGTVIDYHAHIDMKTASGEIVPWLASQSDVLAEDWSIAV